MKKICENEMVIYHGGSTTEDSCKWVTLAGFTLSAAFFMVTFGLGALVIAGIAFEGGRIYCPLESSGSGNSHQNPSGSSRGPR